MAYQYPPATFRPLGPLPPSEPKMTGHDIICVHTMVGTLWGTDAFFKDKGWSGTESHYGTGHDGETLQWVPLDYQADANLNGNPTVISIENADKGEGFPTWSGSDVPLFTPAQVDRLVDLIDKLCRRETHTSCPASWLCHQIGIPRILIPDTKPERRGIGYHRQGIDPWRVQGGVKWSSSDGKVCPGDRRIAQLRDVIVPRVAALALPLEEDMPWFLVCSGQQSFIVFGATLVGIRSGDEWNDFHRDFPGAETRNVPLETYTRLTQRLERV